jgi:hypothetical protein
MPHTRVFPTTLGKADVKLAEDLESGELFLDANEINDDNPLQVADVTDTHVVWMRTDTKISRDCEAEAISIESGHRRYFVRDTKVIILHQRNMWEVWT